MKNICLTFILLISPQLLLAESPFQAEGMQMLMKQMQGIQTCMENIDQSALEKLAGQAEQTHETISKLCEKGDVKGAEKTAMDFVSTLKATPEVKQVQECAKDIPEMMQGHIQMMDIEGMKKQYENKDICSAIKD